MAEATRKQSCAVGEDQQNPSLSIVTPEKECQEQFPVIPYYDKKLQSLISSVTREESATSHTLPNIDENLTAHEPKKDPCFAYVDIQRNVAFRSIDGETSNKDLAIIFKEQARRRRSELVPLQFCHMIKNENENVRFVPVAPNESLPSGAQDWLPFISRKEVAYKEKQALLLQHASNLIGDAFHNDSSSFGEQLNNSPNKDASKLADLNFPKYVEPSAELFKLAHKSLEDLLPQGDCEPFHSSDVVRQYYEYWKPDSVKVIILAESHIFTDEENSRLGPILSEEILPRSEYSGPRDYASVHLCLGYGESKALVPRKNQEPKSTTPKGSSQGTPAFWSILAACSSFSSNETKLLLKKNPTGDSQKKRLLLKLRILQDLKDRGVWLIDASILGYYISQERSYYITWKSKLAHTVTQPRPPNRFYRPSFILSWELYTKHVVRQAAADGCLKLLIPIGKAVENAITKNRLEDAITVPLKTSSCEVTAAFPQPNAWLKHGYEETRQKISQLVNMATPPFRVTRSRGRTTEGGVKLHRIRKGGLENLPQPRTKAARGPGKRKQSSEKTKQLPSTMKEQGNQRRLSELSHSIEPGKQENIPVAAFMAKLNDVYPDSFAAKLNEVYPT